MEKMILTATQAVRSDKFISEQLEDMTRSFIKKLFDDGSITVNGAVVKPSAKLAVGDVIEILVPEPKTAQVKPQNIPLDIVYEDSDVLVINKPRGMVVHPAAGNEDGTLVNAVMFHCGDNLSAIGGVLRPGIVHRIDKDTTGLLAVAKNNAAHLALSEQLKDRSLSRTYYALVHGNIREDKGTVDAPIGRSLADRKKMAVMKDGREAVTDFEVAERFGKYTLVCCKLRTGRTHQIRVHMRYIGHPIVGDRTYGVKSEEFTLDGQLLHAGSIGFIHPSTGERLSFEAPLPKDFAAVLQRLRRKQE